VFHYVPLPELALHLRYPRANPVTFTDDAGQTWRYDRESFDSRGQIRSFYYTRGEYGSGEVMRISNHWADPSAPWPGPWRAAVATMADLEAGGCHPWATGAKNPAPEDPDEELRARWHELKATMAANRDGSDAGREIHDKARTLKGLSEIEALRRAGSRRNQSSSPAIHAALVQHYRRRAWEPVGAQEPSVRERIEEVARAAANWAIAAHDILGDPDVEDAYNAAAQAAASTDT
jgi:hypothetical protein